jgi:Cytochrome P450
VTKNFDYFLKQGIPGPKPLPLVGTLWGIWRKNFVRHDADLVKKYGKTLGIFEGTTPNLVVSDADFIRAVLVKEFDHFVNRRVCRFLCSWLLLTSGKSLNCDVIYERPRQKTMDGFLKRHLTFRARRLFVFFVY